MIGDPAVASVTGRHLTHEEVLANAATYREQAFKILTPRVRKRRATATVPRHVSKT